MWGYERDSIGSGPITAHLRKPIIYKSPVRVLDGTAEVEDVDYSERDFDSDLERNFDPASYEYPRKQNHYTKFGIWLNWIEFIYVS
jgi:hypothetical protein